MDLRSTQIKDTFGNLVTIGSVAGTPTTGTLQNGAGSDITSLTLNGGAVFNEGGGNFDFRVEGDTDANLLFVDASTDRVGIGTSSPAVRLQVETSGAGLGTVSRISRVNGAESHGFNFNVNPDTKVSEIRAFGSTNGDLSFATNNTERLRINSSGNVGIGTTSPSAKLDVVASPSFAGEFNGTNTYLDIVDSTVTGRLQTVANVFNVGTVGAGDSFAIKTEGIERVRVANTGSVGIGTSLPTALLDVRGSAVFNESGADVDFRIEGDTNANLFFVDASADRVGIGTNTPFGLLGIVKDSTLLTEASGAIKIQDSTNGTALIIGADHSVTSAYLQTVQPFTSFSSRYLLLQPNGGRVGIGTSTPAVKLEVADVTTSTINLRRTDSASGSGAIRSVGNTGTVNGAINIGGGVNNNMVFENNGGETMRFDSSNRVGIGTTSPAKKLDVSGEIRASTGILFGSDTAAANTLDDYEEGTWTPVYAPATGSFTSITMDVISATYTKIGNTVHLHGYIRTDAVDTTGASGGVNITGVPFAPTIIGNGICGAQLGWTTNIPTFVNISGTTIFLRRADGVGTVFDSIDVANLTNATDSNRVSFTVTYQTS